VDDRAILDYHRKSAMQTALKDAVDLCRNLSGDLLSSEADWTKLRGMEFAEAIQARNEVTAKLLSLQTDKADRFDEVVRLSSRSRQSPKQADVHLQ
jgi:antiviral helicase SKI2